MRRRLTIRCGGPTLAILIGLALGAGGALLATVSPLVWIGLFGWTGWTWVMTATAAAMGRDATPFGPPPTPPQSDAMIWIGILGTLVVFAILSARAARRGDRLPALGAVSGPLLTGTVSGVLGQFIAFGRDHYTLGTEFVAGLLLSLLGGGVAAAATGLTRSRSSLTRREPQRDGEPSGGQSGRA